jgi:hypothetical protein
MRFWDMAFLAHVQYVEVHYPPATSLTICPERNENVEIQAEMIESFWTSLQYRFPTVQTVLLSHNGVKTSWEGTEGPLPSALQLLLQACPRGIESSVLFLEKKQLPQHSTLTTSVPTTSVPALPKWQRCLLRLAAGGVWERSDADKRRKTILVPPKQFNGPVGRFQRLKYECYTRIPSLQFGLWPLMVEALDRYYFDAGRNESFTCPFTTCEAYFDQAGAWSIHAAEHHVQEWERLPGMLPGEMGVDFAQRNEVLDRRTQWVHEQCKEMQSAWSRDNGAKQGEIQRSWIEQLDSDGAWNTQGKGENSELWLDYVRHMNSTWDGP